MKELSTFLAMKKIVNKGSFIFRQHQVVYKHNKNFDLTMKL